MWIAWLILGFLSVKTWLLIACDTAFYAKINIIVSGYLGYGFIDIYNINKSTYFNMDCVILYLGIKAVLIK